MTVNDIFKYLDSLYPCENICDYDNVGLLVGSPENEVTAAVVALDCTFGAINKAKEIGANLIVTHHPVIFNKLATVTDDGVVFELVKNDISVISMHTNLDQANGGVNDWLCKKIGLKNIKTVFAENGFALRCGKIAPITADDFALLISQKFNTHGKFADGGRLIENVLVCSGGGGEFLKDAIINGYDAFVSADIRHHEFLEAARCGVTIIDAGHFETEDIIVDPLAEVLAEKFSKIEFTPYHTSLIKHY